jgi:hypothetical protein
MNQNIPTKIGAMILVIIAITALTFVWYVEKNQPEINNDVVSNISPKVKLPKNPTNKNQVVCTAEAKKCPDGSYVSKTGSKCEFSECSIPKKDSANKEIIESNGWKTQINNNDGYALSYPAEFSFQSGHNFMNYDINDQRYERGNPDGVKIQINKHILGGNFRSIEEYITYLKSNSDNFTDPAQEVKIGSCVTLAQYLKNGPGGAFMNYMAFDKKSNTYFDILIFEPGFSKNKELIVNIIKTFRIL